MTLEDKRESVKTAAATKMNYSKAIEGLNQIAASELGGNVAHKPRPYRKAVPIRADAKDTAAHGLLLGGWLTTETKI